MNKTLIYVVAGAVLLIGLFFLVKPQPTEPVSNQEQSAKTFDLIIKDNKLVSGPATIQTTTGDLLTIKVIADKDNELHIHGYDKSLKLEKDKQAEITFATNTAGRFHFELETTKTDLGEIIVTPK